MGFRRKIQYFLVKKLKISNKEAIKYLANGQIKINGIPCHSNEIITIDDRIEYLETVIQEKGDFAYYKFYKPRGFESTLNEGIENNILSFMPNDTFFPIGRLDKESEGLMIISNDGRIYDRILRKENHMEKEYIVMVDKIIDDAFIDRMSSGIDIMGKKTDPCSLEKVSKTCFKITLKQGLNRQIRRMCYKMNYEVLSLKRIRIGNIELDELLEGELMAFDLKELGA